MEDREMSWIAVDQSGVEVIFSKKPILKHRSPGAWGGTYRQPWPWVLIPSVTIERLIGRRLSWRDDPLNLSDIIMPEPSGDISNRSTKLRRVFHATAL
jgi:hypothetical protein